MEHDRLAGESVKLRDGPLMSAGLADRLPPTIGDLIGADDERVGLRFRDALGLGGGEPVRRRGRRFAGERGFVDIGRDCLEGEPEALEQHPPVARRRCKHEPAPGSSRGLDRVGY
jgi:hypothetical protein